MAILDTDGVWLAVNGAMLALSGHNCETLLVSDWRDLTHPEDRRRWLITFRRMLRGDREHHRITRRLRHADGRMVWGDLSLSCLRQADGQPWGFLVQVLDANARVWSRQLLGAELDEVIPILDQLYRSCGELVVRLDGAGIIRWVSPSLTPLLGWRPADWLGRHRSEFLDDGGGDCPEHRHGRGPLPLGEAQVCQERIRHRNGTLHWLESVISPFRDPGGSVDGLLLSGRLIDGRKAEEEAVLRRVEALKHRLRSSLSAAMVAHEIKKPLGMLLLNSDLALAALSQGTHSPAMTAERILQIRKDARTVVRTIERLHNLLRSLPSRLVAIDLATVVTSALLYQRPRLQQRGIALETVGHDQVWPLRGDGDQLQIALNNLIDNSIDALEDQPPTGACLRISLEARGSQVVLEVADNGPGLADPRLERMLLRSSKAGGTGLGLALVERIAANHLGTIELGRSELGGASVRLCLPRLPDPA